MSGQNVSSLCLLWTENLPVANPTNEYVETLIPNVMVFGDRASER